MFDAQKDPLGNSLKQRARAYQADAEAFDADDYASLRALMPSAGLYGPLRQASGRRAPSGPLRDPQWDALFQAMDEVGVDRVRSAPGATLPSSYRALRGR